MISISDSEEGPNVNAPTTRKRDALEEHQISTHVAIFACNRVFLTIPEQKKRMRVARQVLFSSDNETLVCLGTRPSVLLP